MQIEKCFFCDKIIIPINFPSMSDIEEFFKVNNITFTLNYVRSRKKIGNKKICLSCEIDLKNIIEEDNQECEECKNKKERFGEEDD
jgi:hypothetical protein